VKGLLMGEAQKYVNKILQAFDKAGYYVTYKLLDASKMGVPQKRQRVFFTAIRKDLYKGHFVDLFQSEPSLKLEFNEKEIPFGKIQEYDDNRKKLSPTYQRHWANACKETGYVTLKNGNTFGFYYTAVKHRVFVSMTAGNSEYGIEEESSFINDSEIIKLGSFPSDYIFLNQKPKYLIGMSVPPLMTARIANELKKQWLDKV